MSGWGANIEAAGSYAASTDADTSNQMAYESNSTHTSVISYGGAPGSFGPPGGNGNAPSNWADWAGTVDLLPIPLDYKVDRVYNLLLKYLIDGVNVSAQWAEAEIVYYDSYASEYYASKSLFIPYPSLPFPC